MIGRTLCQKLQEAFSQPFMFDQMTAAVALVQAGKLKLLAVTTGKRIALAPHW